MTGYRLLSRRRSVANRNPRPRTQSTPHSSDTAPPPAAMGMSVRELGLWFTFIHATGVLLLVPIAFAQQLLPLWAELSSKAGADASYSDLLWSAREQLRVTEPTTLEMFIAAFAGSYYSMDFIMMWCNVHPLSMMEKLWFTVHHIFCFVGLTFPPFVHSNALDTVLAFTGFWFGEVSNPPRCVVDLVQCMIDDQTEKHVARSAGAKASSSNSRSADGNGVASGNGSHDGSGSGVALSTPVVTAPALSHVRLLGRSVPMSSVKVGLSSLLQWHIGLFMAFRIVGVKFMYYVVWPFASIPVTNVTGAVTLVLSLMAVVVMLQGAANAKKEAAAAKKAE